MNWTVQQKIRIGFWLLPILPVIFCFIFIRTTLALIDSNDAVARTGNIMRSVLSLQSGVKDLEVTQREYILSGEMKSLKDFEEDKALVLHALKDLQQLSKGHEVRARYIDALADVIPQKFEELQKTIEVRRSQGVSAASQLLLNESNRPIEDIERLTRSMLKMETARHKDSAHSQRLDLCKTSFVFVAILILVMLLIWFL